MVRMASEFPETVGHHFPHASGDYDLRPCGARTQDNQYIYHGRQEAAA